MATSIISNSAQPQQPGLRSFIVCDQPVEGCLTFEVNDEGTAPHLRRGDFAIIDPADREPMNGELFLIEWQSSGQRQIVELRRFPNPDRIANWDGVTEYWNACWRAAMRSADSSGTRTMQWHDGPYRPEGITERIIGRVVGIFEPDFRGQLLAA